MKFAGIAAAFASLVLSLSLFSCAAADDDTGSLCITMPGSPSARSISSTGAVTEEEIMTYSVYIRNSDNVDVEKYTNVPSGTTLTVDQLKAGTYNVAIRGVTIGDDEVECYGLTQAEVKGNTDNTASITLEPYFGGCSILFYDSLGLNGDKRINARATCKNGDSYTILEDRQPNELDHSEAGFLYQNEGMYFFEPGFTYTLDVSVYMYGVDSAPYTVKKSAVATSEGIFFTVD